MIQSLSTPLVHQVDQVVKHALTRLNTSILYLWMGSLEISNQMHQMCTSCSRHWGIHREIEEVIKMHTPLRIKGIEFSMHPIEC